MTTQKFLSISALVAALGMSVVSNPAYSMGLKTDGDNGGDTQALEDTSGWEVVHEGKIKAVTITNQETGEQGCHNRETQTSTPGPC